jgi:hypothetical protein
MVNDVCHIISITNFAIILVSMSHLFTFSSFKVTISLLALSALLVGFSLPLSFHTVLFSLLAFSSLVQCFSLSCSHDTVTISLHALNSLVQHFSLSYSHDTVMISHLAFSCLVQRFSLSFSHDTVTISLLAFSTFLLSFGVMFCILRKSILFPMGILFSCDNLRRSLCIFLVAGLVGFLAQCLAVCFAHKPTIKIVSIVKEEQH